MRAARVVRRVLAAVVVFLLAPGLAAAQTGTGIPRTPQGKPDLSGIWQALNSAAWNIQAHPAEKGVPGGMGVVEGNEIPYQPWAAEKKKQNFAARATADPEARCYLPGIPRATYMPFPFQIVQTNTEMVMLYEYVHAVRRIRLEAPHYPTPAEWWMGDSSARWDGDTLVIDVTHFTDQTWFDRAGNFHSEELHVVERYTPVSRDHLNYEVTIEDPKVFTRPWKMSMPLYRRLEKELQLLDYDCYTFDFEFPWATDLN